MGFPALIRRGFVVIAAVEAAVHVGIATGTGVIAEHLFRVFQTAAAVMTRSSLNVEALPRFLRTWHTIYVSICEKRDVAKG